MRRKLTPAEQAQHDQDQAFIDEYGLLVWLLAAKGFLTHGPGVVLMRSPTPGEARYLPASDIFFTKLPDNVHKALQYVNPRYYAVLVFLGEDGNYRAAHLVKTPEKEKGE